MITRFLLKVHPHLVSDSEDVGTMGESIHILVVDGRGSVLTRSDSGIKTEHTEALQNGSPFVSATIQIHGIRWISTKPVHKTPALTDSVRCGLQE